MWVKPDWIPCKQGSWVRAWESRLPLCWETARPSRRAPLRSRPSSPSPGFAEEAEFLFSWQQRQVIKAEDAVEPFLCPPHDGGKGQRHTKPLFTLTDSHCFYRKFNTRPLFVFTIMKTLLLARTKIVFWMCHRLLFLVRIGCQEGRLSDSVSTIKIPSNFILGIYLLQNWMWVTCQAAKLTRGSLFSNLTSLTLH